MLLVSSLLSLKSTLRVVLSRSPQLISPQFPFGKQGLEASPTMVVRLEVPCIRDRPTGCSSDRRVWEEAAIPAVGVTETFRRKCVLEKETHHNDVNKDSTWMPELLN